MSWSHCGKDKQGRLIGYAHEAVCDHEGCNKIIDRGLSYACGGMHGEDEHSCDKYFCSEHLEWTLDLGDEYKNVCEACMVRLTTSGDYALNVEDWVIRPINRKPDESFDFSNDDEDPWFGDDMMGASG